MTAPMTKARRREILTEWRARSIAWREFIDAVDKLLGLVPEGMMQSAMFDLLDQYTRAVAELVGDTAAWLDWYATENDYGRKGLAAGHNDKLRPIRTVAQLARLIEVAE